MRAVSTLVASERVFDVWQEDRLVHRHRRSEDHSLAPRYAMPYTAAVESALPKVRPLALKRRATAFDNPDWLFELKYDGFRALLEIDGAGARLVSRNRNRFKHLDTLAAALSTRLRVKEAILDGEVICADETGRPIFLEMLRGRYSCCFIAFDILWLNGEDLRPLPLIERKKRLTRLLRRRSNHLITMAMTVEGRGKALMAAVEEHDLEGIVAKRKSDPYRRVDRVQCTCRVQCGTLTMIRLSIVTITLLLLTACHVGFGIG